jgi:hypothetical protein
MTNTEKYFLTKQAVGSAGVNWDYNSQAPTFNPPAPSPVAPGLGNNDAVPGGQRQYLPQPEQPISNRSFANPPSLLSPPSFASIARRFSPGFKMPTQTALQGISSYGTAKDTATPYA